VAVSGRNEDWAFVSGLVAAREGHMLPAAFFAQVLTESGPDGILARLGETILRDRLREAADLRRLDRRVAECQRDCLEEFRSICPSPEIPDLLELPRHFVSFKNFVKRTEMKLDAQDALPSRYADEVWERLWAGLKTGLPGCFQEAAERARPALQSAPKRPEALDAAVDAVALSALCEEAEHCGPFVAEHFRRCDTARGVEILWRARLLGLDEGVVDLIAAGRREAGLFRTLRQSEEQDWPDVLREAMPELPAGVSSAAEGTARVRAFARAADEWLMAHARTARCAAFGPERVFGYLVGLEAELYNLEVAAGGRVGGIAAEELAPRLRACYV